MPRWNKIPPTKEYLNNEYIIKDRDIIAISMDIGYSANAVWEFLKYHNVPIKDKSSRHLIHTELTKDFLHQEYVINKKSAIAIGKELNTNPKNIYEALYRNDIVSRTKKEAAPAGEKCYLWQGGCSKLPYAFSFNTSLKNKIKQRDDFTCQLCGTQEELRIHHIDYDKLNSDEHNLITLCVRCNTKVNHNRVHWMTKFQTLMSKVEVR